MMKEGGREILRVVRRVAMLPIHQVALDNVGEGGIVKPSLAQPIERRGEAGNAHGEKEAARSQDTMRFMQSPEPVNSLGQLLQPTKQQHQSPPLVMALHTAPHSPSF